MARRKKQKKNRRRQEPPVTLRVERERVFRLDVDQEGLSIGSGDMCGLRIAHHKVAQVQGRIVFVDGQGTYYDRGEVPGVRVFGAGGTDKGLEAGGTCSIQSGDRLVLGSIVAVAEVEVSSFLHGVLWATIREVVMEGLEVQERTVTVGTKETCTLQLDVDYARPLSGRLVRMQSDDWAYEDMGAHTASMTPEGKLHTLEPYRMHRLQPTERLVIGAPSDRVVFGVWDTNHDIWLGSYARRPRTESPSIPPEPRPDPPSPEPPKTDPPVDSTPSPDSSHAPWSGVASSDSSVGSHWREEQRREYSRVERYECLIQTAIAIARAQGTLTSNAVAAIRDGLEHILGGLSDTERQDIRAAMKSATEHDLDDAVRKLKTLEIDQRDLLSFLHHVASLSGTLTMDAYRVLKRVGFVFSASQEWRDMCAQLGVVRQYSLDVLGLRDETSLDEIKRAYRVCVGQFHPDRFINADEQTRMMANDKTREINRAYDFLAKK